MYIGGCICTYVYIYIHIYTCIYICIYIYNEAIEAELSEAERLVLKLAEVYNISIYLSIYLSICIFIFIYIYI